MAKPPPYSSGLEVSRREEGLEVIPQDVQRGLEGVGRERNASHRERDLGYSELDGSGRERNASHRERDLGYSGLESRLRPSSRRQSEVELDGRRSPLRQDARSATRRNVHEMQEENTGLGQSLRPRSEEQRHRAQQSKRYPLSWMIWLGAVLAAAGAGTSVGTYFVGRDSVDCTPPSPYVPLAPAQVTTLNGTCPSTIRIPESPSLSFGCLENTDLAGVHDIFALTAYTLQACIEACATYNAVNSSALSCKAAVLGTDMSAAYADYGFNCWLKSEYEEGDLRVDEARTVVFAAVPI